MGISFVAYSISQHNLESVRADPALVWRVIEPDNETAYLRQLAEDSRTSLLKLLFWKRMVPVVPKSLTFSEVELKVLDDFSSKKASKTEIRLMNFQAQLAMSPWLLLVLSLLLAGCGGGDTVDREDPLEPSVVFSEPDPLLGGGTAKATLEVVNNSSKTITGVVAVFSFPADVQIEGGSVGGTCGLVSSGNTSSEGYRVTFYNLPSGQKCGVFMDILSTAGSGVKVFSVSPGDITGDGVSPNEQLYSWEWTAP